MGTDYSQKMEAWVDALTLEIEALKARIAELEAELATLSASPPKSD